MLADNAGDGDSQAQRLERMKNEFLLAQQRRRDRVSRAVPRPETDEGPLMSGPADGSPTGIAAVRP
jgi:hypothetical protein